MKNVLRIPGFLRLLLLVGFVQAVLADSAAIPARSPEPVAQECFSADPPGRPVFQQDLFAGVLPAGLPSSSPLAVVRVLAIPWHSAAPSTRSDWLTFSGLSPPVALS